MNTRKHRFPWQLGLSLVVILSIVLAACGTTSAPATEPAATTQPEQPAEPTATQAPKENIATYAFARSISELDPSLVLTTENNVLWNVWGNLTFWDPGKGVIPFVAESWEANADNSVWTFHLREGTKCHDGSDFTAEDVKFSFERTIEKGSLAYVFAMVDNIQAPDPLTAVINLKYPFRMDANLANNWGTFLMCKNVGDKPPEWFAAGNENGVGPYVIESFDPGQRMVLAKFDGWQGEWPANSFDKVVIEIVEDAAVRVQKLRAGEADAAWQIPYDDFDSLNASGIVTAVAEPAFQQLQWHLNTRRPPLDDLRVRQALLHSFPYEAAQQATYGGASTIAKGAVPRLMWSPATETRVYDYDLEKAKTLLEEAGVTEGTQLILGVQADTPEPIQVAALWQAELAKLGINLRIDKISSAARYAEVYNPDTEYNIMLMTMVVGFDSPNEYLGSLWHTKMTWYPFSGFSSPEFDALIEEGLAKEATNKEASDAAYQRGEQILFDQAVAVFALDTPQDFAYSNSLEGFSVNPLYGYEVFWWQLGRK
jgi:peptide/nickel transport system substrate-binding protein